MSPAQLPAFFARRWRGEVPLQTVLWRDTLAVGTAVNLLATFAALIMASQGGPTWAAAVIHFSPLPYNLFLFAAVGRARPRTRLAAIVSVVWLAAMTIV